MMSHSGLRSLPVTESFYRCVQSFTWAAVVYFDLSRFSLYFTEVFQLSGAARELSDVDILFLDEDCSGPTETFHWLLFIDNIDSGASDLLKTSLRHLTNVSWKIFCPEFRLKEQEVRQVLVLDLCHSRLLLMWCYCLINHWTLSCVTWPHLLNKSSSTVNDH